MSIAIITESGKDKMRDINVGIIGCGGIANGKHMPSLKKLENVKMVAFCDIIPERADEAKREYGSIDAKVFTDYKQLLEMDGIEVIHVLTPNNSHAEISIAAMEAGKHVMCEKPLADSWAKAQEMVAVSKRTGKKLTVGYQTRSTPGCQFVRKLVQDGDLGDIYYTKALSVRRRGAPLWGVFLDKEKQGGGPMIDVGTHCIDASLFMMGNYDVASVTGSVYRKLADTAMHSNPWGIWDPKDFQVEDSAMGYVKFKNGATMVIEASWLLNMLDPGPSKMCGTVAGVELLDDTVRINGEKNGSLYINEVKPNSTARTLFKGENLTAEEYEAKQWIYSVINDLDPITLPEQACVVSQIIEGIYKSAETNTTIYY